MIWFELQPQIRKKETQWCSYQKYTENDADVFTRLESRTDMHCRPANSMKSAELTESCPFANWCRAIFLISNMLLCPGRELNVHTWKETWIDDWYHLDIF